VNAKNKGRQKALEPWVFFYSYLKFWVALADISSIGNAKRLSVKDNLLKLD
jgi:hypothetical protein